MTIQAIELLWEFARNSTTDEQRAFASYFNNVTAEYYTPKGIVITGRTMEAIIENFETEEFTEKATPSQT